MTENKDVKPGLGTAPETPRDKAAPDLSADSEQSLGRMMAAARERRGASQAEASREARIPAYYVRMIESDDYHLISDQLYLLPFLRRYATFVGLDPEEVASRFIREVQRTDASAARMSEPIPMAEKKRLSWGRLVLGTIVGATLGAGAFFVYHYFRVAGRPGSAFPVPTASAPISSPSPLGAVQPPAYRPYSH